MYEQFFNFTEAPFQLVPNARYFFPSSKHKRAIDCLGQVVTPVKYWNYDGDQRFEVSLSLLL